MKGGVQLREAKATTLRRVLLANVATTVAPRQPHTAELPPPLRIPQWKEDMPRARHS
jgi:hypothetical protein